MIKLATIALSLLVAMTYQYEQGAKPGPLYKLCGNDFVQAWQDCCDYGYPNCANVPVVDAVEALERRGEWRVYECKLGTVPLRPNVCNIHRAQSTA